MKIILYFFTAFIFSCSGDHDQSEEESPVGHEPVQEEAFAFPTAEGFGMHATGGRGGKVIYVSKLSDDGSKGTLRYAINQPGARYIVFSTGGAIFLNSELKIENPNLTIAGQSAPGEGISIAGYPVSIAADNIIIRFLRFRMGDLNDVEGDALGSRFNKNIIIDHCSMSWSTDECVSIYNNENTTLQWCLIAESLRNSAHAKGAHGYGGIWGGKNASFHHNLLAHHDSRNPRLGEYAGSAFALTDLVDVRNNVIYNWQGNSIYGGEAMNVNIVNNYYKPGPATSKKERIVAIDKNLNEDTEVYNIWGKFFIDGNFVEGSTRASENNWEFGVYNQIHSKYGSLTEEDKNAMKIESPHSIDDNVETQSAQQAYEAVLAKAGNTMFRDKVDEHVIADVKNKSFTYSGSRGSTNGIIDTQSDVGGYPELDKGTALKDSDLDGMPNDWEIENNLDPDKFDANDNDLSTGYDNLEVYLNSLTPNK